MLQTEYEFCLPKGYIDENGELHRQGRMRLACARDEIDSMREAGNNEDIAQLALLSRVVTSLGTLKEVTPEIIGGLFTGDFGFLQEMYQTVNSVETPVMQVECPYCKRSFEDTVNFRLWE